MNSCRDILKGGHRAGVALTINPTITSLRDYGIPE